MATIVLVHGIDQQQKSADTLENDNGFQHWLGGSA